MKTKRIFAEADAYFIIQEILKFQPNMLAFKCGLDLTYKLGAKAQPEIKKRGEQNFFCYD